MVGLVICIGSLLIALVGILELCFGKNLLYENFIFNPYYNRYIKYYPRPMSTQLNPAVLGSYLLGCLPFSLYFLKNKSFYLRLLGVFSALLCFSVIMLTFSRGVFLGLAVMLSVYLWIGRKKKLFVLFSLFLVLLILVCSYQGDVNLNRFGFKRMILGSCDSIISEHRLQRLGMSVRMLKDYPWLGIGFTHFRIRFYEYYAATDREFYEFMIPDNMYLTILAETGIVGTIGFLMFIFSLFKKGIKHFSRLTGKKEKVILLTALSALIGLLVNMGEYDLFYWANPYMLFCLICGFIHGAIKSIYEH